MDSPKTRPLWCRRDTIYRILQEVRWRCVRSIPLSTLPCARGTAPAGPFLITSSRIFRARLSSPRVRLSQRVTVTSRSSGAALNQASEQLLRGMIEVDQPQHLLSCIASSKLRTSVSARIWNTCFRRQWQALVGASVLGRSSVSSLHLGVAADLVRDSTRDVVF